MKIATTLALLAAGQSAAFLSPTTPLTHNHRSSSSVVPSSLLYAQQNDESFDDDITNNNDNAALLTRRSILSSSLLTSSALLLLPTFTSSNVANADDSAAPTVVVAGATGQTGRRILERLASQPNISVVGGVRNVDKANKELSESSTVVRGAMIQKVPSLSAAGLELRKLDGTFVLCSHMVAVISFFIVL